MAADEINKMLKIMCENNGFIFVNNSELEPFLDDAVHLNWEGRKRIVNKYIQLLNNWNLGSEILESDHIDNDDAISVNEPDEIETFNKLREKILTIHVYFIIT